ncbi:winged helix DNA-binding domain-containing protein [Micromonospora sp. RHAY321]|uniref:winged helix DNA-binding domain-containing protein n=1 Tax=Micromonospora sp. RHAY321 TaxID=2944807 RepID=UPI00207CC22F|nr:winged helix DNA-binding domain-containing protein [Micromonospora sp. RHAY321]MCO1593970.1 winged helix DNA-binding domain-containing protein [Micromonospora sp. RHAY321]
MAIDARFQPQHSGEPAYWPRGGNMISGARLRVSESQRRARLSVRHALIPEGIAKDAGAVAGSLVAIHATDPPTVYLSVAARTRLAGPVDVAAGLHAPSMTRMTGMRRTVFVLQADLAPTVLEATARPLALRDRATILRLLDAHLGWTEDHLTEIEDSIVALVIAKGTITGRELAEALPVLRTKIRPSSSPSSTAPGQPVSMRILYNLAMTGRICRGRPLGGWTSGQYTWSPPAPMATIEPRAARADLLSHYLARYGPVTEADVRWWTGWTVTQTRQSLADVNAVAVELSEGQTGYVAPDDLDPVEPPELSVALLPALDSTVMGWRDRAWYLPSESTPALFDRTGNAGPTVWVNGQVVGGWAQDRIGRINWRLLNDVGAREQRAIAAEAERLSTWLGGSRVSPRFHTPLERELSDSPGHKR